MGNNRNAWSSGCLWETLAVVAICLFSGTGIGIKALAKAQVTAGWMTAGGGILVVAAVTALVMIANRRERRRALYSGKHVLRRPTSS